MTTYYVSSINGSDSAAGTSSSAPLATLQAAADLTKPGDTVVVGDGTYTAQANGSALTITTSGTAGAPITYEAAAGAHPVIEVPAAAWGGIFEDASYIVISGFEVAGNAQNVTLAYAQSQETNLSNPTTSADGIDVGYVGDTTTPQHVTIENNVVHDLPGGGIVATYSDYVTIQSNTVYNNAFYSPFGNSGITLGFSQDVDGYTGIKNYVIDNIAYDNQQLVPTASQGSITDGEGIIIDDNSNDQTNGKQYVGGTLVENNLTYGNGGPGIETYDSSNASVLYNTTYNNGSTGVNSSEIFVNDAKNTTVENNIMYARSGGQTGSNVGSTGTTWDYNLLYGGTSGITGSHDITADPLFVDAGADNFDISSDSPAIGAANTSFPDAVDIAGNPRPGSQMDIGAYQYVAPAVAASPNGTMITSASAGPIIDASGNRWTLVPSQSEGLQIAVNGTVDGVTAHVVLLELLSGKIEQENASGNWYTEPGPGGPWTQIAAPSIKVTGSAMGRSSTVNAAATGTTVARGDTFVLTAPGVATVTCGLIAGTLTFSGLSAITLTGGRAATTIIADGGANTFTAGNGSMIVTGGAGGNRYIYHKGDGLMTVTDFSIADGDSLTVDKSLQSVMTERSDGHGGEVFGFGASGQGIDLAGVTSVTAAQIHFV